ncbi:MAG: PAS domain-containing protein [Gammaproteobacteria bacterium]|jgi:PAS domain S-box-containing protein
MVKKSTCESKLKQEHNKCEKQLLELREKLKAEDIEVFRLKSILDSIPGSIYWKDKNGVYLGRNSYSSEKMESVGLESEINIDDIIGKTDYDLFPKETADRYRKYDLEVLKTGKEISNEEPVTLPNGRILIQLSTKRPLRNEKKEIIGIIGNTVDITYQKEIEQSLREAKEQAEEASRVKTSFIRNMEHDIRTPFNGVWGIANYLYFNLLLLRPLAFT